MNIEQHRANNHISIDRYVKSRQVELGRSIDRRSPIYLDMNYWIKFRDAAAGFKSDEGTNEQLNLLRELVKSGIIFCPISESVFLELLKQTNINSRLKTALLIDDLSL